MLLSLFYVFLPSRPALALSLPLSPTSCSSCVQRSSPSSLCLPFETTHLEGEVEAEEHLLQDHRQMRGEARGKLVGQFREEDEGEVAAAGRNVVRVVREEIVEGEIAAGREADEQL